MLKVIGFTLVIANTGGHAEMSRYDDLVFGYKGSSDFETKEGCEEAARFVLDNYSGSGFVLTCLPLFKK